MAKLQGKVAVITGGSSGQGLATAKRFVEEGAFVYITGRRQAELDKAVSLIGRSVAAVQGDVSNLADLDRLYAKVASEKGKIDILFAAAGIVDPQPLAETTEESFDKAFAINTRGLAFTVKKALPLLNDGGSIILSPRSPTRRASPVSASTAPPRRQSALSSAHGRPSWRIVASGSMRSARARSTRRSSSRWRRPGHGPTKLKAAGCREGRAQAARPPGGDRVGRLVPRF